MTDKEILDIAMAQSAIDSNCNAEDFYSHNNKIVISKKNQKARKYLELPFCGDLTSYGNNIVASVAPELRKIIGDYINKYQMEHCFETPNLHSLIDSLKPFGVNACFMAEYFLPTASLKEIECKYPTKILVEKDFQDLYRPEWSNALCGKRRDLDKLAVGAYQEGELVGLAGCSADCDSMWQIGVDVLPNFRGQGVATALTNKLARVLLEKNIVPFYCCAWSNIKSARNAIASGLKPSWVQLTIKPDKLIKEMNNF